jgi:DNA-directed RNA polymerase alpha subunit
MRQPPRPGGHWDIKAILCPGAQSSYFYPRLDAQVEATWQKSIDELEWSVRAYNCLRHADPPIKTIGQLVSKTEAELLRVKNLGRVTLAEIVGQLATVHLALGRRRYR